MLVYQNAQNWSIFKIFSQGCSCSETPQQTCNNNIFFIYTMNPSRKIVTQNVFNVHFKTYQMILFLIKIIYENELSKKKI